MWPPTAGPAGGSPSPRRPRRVRGEVAVQAGGPSAHKPPRVLMLFVLVGSASMRRGGVLGTTGARDVPPHRGLVEDCAVAKAARSVDARAYLQVGDRFAWRRQKRFFRPYHRI